MLFQMKIQPIDSFTPDDSISNVAKPTVTKSRFKRLFEKQFSNIRRTSSLEKVDGFGDFDPSSVCLQNMVQKFIEDSNDKQSTAIKCVRNRSNCFNGICDDSSDDDSDFSWGFGEPNSSVSGEACEMLKNLVSCESVLERNLLADTAKVVEKNKICKRKDGVCRKIVTDGLLALGYNASICKSHWEKSPSFPAGVYEYIDVIVADERLLIDIDFRSEFEIARSTKTYKTILQTLPHIFVGNSDRLQKIIVIVMDAAKQSLKKKGMHLPPWRKAEYVKAKWFSSYTRTSQPPPSSPPQPSTGLTVTNHFDQKKSIKTVKNKPSESKKSAESDADESVFVLSESSGEEDEKKQVVKEWKLPAILPRKKTSFTGVEILTGLASLIEDKP